MYVINHLHSFVPHVESYMDGYTMGKSKYGGAGRGYGDIRKVKTSDASSFVVKKTNFSKPSSKELVLSSLCLFLLYLERKRVSYFVIFFFKEHVQEIRFLVECLWLSVIAVVFSIFFIHPFKYVLEERLEIEYPSDKKKKLALECFILIAVTLLSSFSVLKRLQISNLVDVIRNYPQIQVFVLFFESLIEVLIYESCIFRCAAQSDEGMSTDPIIKSFGLTILICTLQHFPFSSIADFLLCPIIKLLILIGFRTYPSIILSVFYTWIYHVLRFV